jgi:hypothetical protein
MNHMRSKDTITVWYMDGHMREIVSQKKLRAALAYQPDGDGIELPVGALADWSSDTTTKKTTYRLRTRSKAMSVYR